MTNDHLTTGGAVAKGTEYSLYDYIEQLEITEILNIL